MDKRSVRAVAGADDSALLMSTTGAAPECGASDNRRAVQETIFSSNESKPSFPDQAAHWIESMTKSHSTSTLSRQ
jgi:tellurite resistance-related uncharacterized protein